MFEGKSSLSSSFRLRTEQQRIISILEEIRDKKIRNYTGYFALVFSILNALINLWRFISGR
jgi:hypothetical protein